MSRIGIYPSESQLLLLKSILFPPKEAIHFWSKWKAVFQPQFSSAEELFDAQDENIRRLLPLAWFNLQAHEDEWVGWLKGYARHAWARQQKLQHEANRVYSFFENNGLNPIMLKGLAMSRSSYPMMAFRVMNDLDLYIPLAHRDKAFSLLNRLGYQIRPEDEAFMSLSHASQFQKADRMEVDLHWHLFQEHLYPSADLPFLNDINLIEYQGLECRKLNPTAQFFHSLYQCSHWDELPNIRWVVDCVLIARTEVIDWEKVILWTESLCFQAFVADALAFLRDEFGVPIPASVFLRLKALPENRYAKRYFELATRPQKGRIDLALLKAWYKWKGFPNPDESVPFRRILAWKLKGKWLWYKHRINSKFTSGR